MASPAPSYDTSLPDLSLNKAESCSSELFSLVYGAFTVQLLQDEHDDVVEVNRILDRVVISSDTNSSGCNIGNRIVDEFIIQTGINNCRSFKETAEIIGRHAFKMFLGAPATVQNWSEDGNAFSLILPTKDNPLVDFVELPERYADLNMCGILAGVIRGALEMIQIRSEVSIVKDSLQGDEHTEIRVVRKSVERESFNPDDE